MNDAPDDPSEVRGEDEDSAPLGPLPRARAAHSSLREARIHLRATRPRYEVEDARELHFSCFARGTAGSGLPLNAARDFSCTERGTFRACAQTNKARKARMASEFADRNPLSPALSSIPWLDGSAAPRTTV